MLASYRVFLFPCVKNLSALITVDKVPRLIPAGATHGSEIESVKA